MCTFEEKCKGSFLEKVGMDWIIVNLGDLPIVNKPFRLIFERKFFHSYVYHTDISPISPQLLYRFPIQIYNLYWSKILPMHHLRIDSNQFPTRYCLISL